MQIVTIWKAFNAFEYQFEAIESTIRKVLKHLKGIRSIWKKFECKF